MDGGAEASRRLQLRDTGLGSLRTWIWKTLAATVSHRWRTQGERVMRGDTWCPRNVPLAANVVNTADQSRSIYGSAELMGSRIVQSVCRSVSLPTRPATSATSCRPGGSPGCVGLSLSGTALRGIPWSHPHHRGSERHAEAHRR